MTELDGQEEKPFELDLGLHQVCEFPGHEQSTVVGVDNYLLRAFNGAKKEWRSFTLTANEDLPEGHPDKRWWAVNLPEIGAHFLRVATPEEADYELNLPDYSGLVELVSEGDHHLSGNKGYAIGSLGVYQREDGTLYFEEILDNGNHMRFVGFPYKPEPE